MATQSLKERIAEAESAYHSLLTGTMARVVVDQNGERVEFTAAKRQDLYRYIQELKGQQPGSSSGGSQPAQFLF